MLQSSSLDPRDELGQPSLGATRIHGELLKLGIERGPDLGCQVHGAAKTTSIARVEDFPSKSCGWDRRDRPVCGSDDLISVTIWGCSCWDTAVDAFCR
jgi:hypothetical protein